MFGSLNIRIWNLFVIWCSRFGISTLGFRIAGWRQAKLARPTKPTEGSNVQLSYLNFFLNQFLEIVGPEPPLLCHSDEAYILRPFAKEQRTLGVRGHRIIT